MSQRFSRVYMPWISCLMSQAGHVLRKLTQLLVWSCFWKSYSGTQAYGKVFDTTFLWKPILLCPHPCWSICSSQCPWKVRVWCGSCHHLVLMHCCWCFKCYWDMVQSSFSCIESKRQLPCESLFPGSVVVFLIFSFFSPRRRGSSTWITEVWGERQSRGHRWLQGLFVHGKSQDLVLWNHWLWRNPQIEMWRELELRLLGCELSRWLQACGSTCSFLKQREKDG